MADTEIVMKLSCTDLFVPGSSSYQCMARTHICAHVKDPVSICCKRVGLTAGGVRTQKHCTHGNNNSWVAPLYCSCSLSPGKAA